MSTYAYLTKDGYLAHRGIKGQRWGVRRYQNADGTYTSEGYSHYGIQPGRRGIVGKIAERRELRRSVAGYRADNRQQMAAIKQQMKDSRKEPGMASIQRRELKQQQKRLKEERDILKSWTSNANKDAYFKATDSQQKKAISGMIKNQDVRRKAIASAATAVALKTLGKIAVTAGIAALGSNSEGIKQRVMNAIKSSVSGNTIASKDIINPKANLGSSHVSNIAAKTATNLLKDLPGKAKANIQQTRNIPKIHNTGYKYNNSLNNLPEWIKKKIFR